MKFKHKYTLAIAITVAMFSNVIVYAASNNSLEDKNKTVKEAVVIKTSGKIDLTLQTAIDMIESNNYDIKLLDKKITIAEKEYKEADDKKGKAYVRNSKNARTSVLDIKMQQEYNWRKALLDLRNCRNDRDEKIKALKNETEKLYLDILITKDELNASENEIKVLDNKIQEAKIKIKNGFIKESDLKSIELEKTQLLSRISTQKGGLNKDIIKLKNYLGLSSDVEVSLAANNYDLLEIEDKDIEAKINAAIDGSYELKQKQEELELANVNSDLSKRYSFTKDEFFIDNLNETVKEKELQLEGVKPNLEAQLWRSYYNLKSLENVVKIETLSLKNAEASLIEIRGKIASGSLSKIEENNAVNVVQMQKIKVQKAINEYMVSGHTFTSKLEVSNKEDK